MQSYLPDGVLENFVAEHLRSKTPRDQDNPGPNHRVELMAHRNAKTVYEHRYFGHRIIAKVYDNPRAGDLAYQAWRALWTQGFGPGSIHRVPEPLIYLPERRTLLMEPAPGTCLMPLVLRDQVACRAGMRHAALWLADLHTSPVRAGAPANPARILFRLARRLVRTVSLYPELEPKMTALITELERRADVFAAGGPHPMVQTHGRYHCGHVYVADGAVTVIDLDRSAPSDPAQDVAEFICRFRVVAQKEAVKKCLKNDLGTIGTRIFIDEYARAGESPLSGLLYFWSATLLGLMLDSTFKRYFDDDIRSARMVYYQSEFAELPELVATLGQPV